MTHHLSCQELPTCRHWGWHGIALPLNFTQLCTTETMQHHSWQWEVFCWLLEVISPFSGFTSVPAQRCAAQFSLKQQLSEYEKRHKLCLVCNPTWWCREKPGLGPGSIKSEVGHWNYTSVGENGIWFCFIFFLNSRFKRLYVSWKYYLSKPTQM